jgi:chorismatase
MTAPLGRRPVARLDPAAHLPGWLRRAAGLAEPRPISGCAEARIERLGDPAAGYQVLAARASVADDPTEEHFADRVALVYERLIGALRDDGLSAWRFWNYVPDIHRAGKRYRRRYEAFNAGRYRSLAHLDVERKQSPPATAVGHRGTDLFVYALAGASAGETFENPRQRPAYEYSRLHGEFPPVFARAIRLPRTRRCGMPSALVAGTASIVGETSRHEGDIETQTREMLSNLATLPGLLSPIRTTAPGLDCYREMRTYVVRAEDAPTVRQLLQEAMSGLRVLEILQADLCRPELLVEAEGTLDLTSARPSADGPARVSRS